VGKKGGGGKEATVKWWKTVAVLGLFIKGHKAMTGPNERVRD